VAEVRRFMIVFGLVSTLFDLLAFAVLLVVFEAGETLFQTAWFVVSLLTELGVVLVLRTQGPAWKSTPSRLLLWTTLAVAAAALALPYFRPLAAAFGFVPLPAQLMLAALIIVAAYVATTEGVKQRFYRR
jgi:Mg2+-importing ATPase